ncbi:hypothetical protein QUC31_018997 [Theobroma cacao]|uniref:Uncharacterized protein n=1 Tax=Theobroma cacao TaxID=3641 RepID=A0A061GVA2_THECC|nr:Uncharacterized protein TCM_041294 [Theobroma cacao]
MAPQANNESKKLAFTAKIESNNFPKTDRQSSYYAALDSELDSSSPLISTYTSLKDLMPSSKGSQSQNNPYSAGSTIASAYEIPITNLLVKKAAWVYLQPMALPPNSSSTTPKEHILCRAWVEVKSPVKACFRFIRRTIIHKIACAFEKFSGAILFGRSSSLGMNHN